tara:strand:+ start:1006 stop:2712 length:1707 start_codon:yes stop_codon:yes gene_type:complete
MFRLILFCIAIICQASAKTDWKILGVEEPIRDAIEHQLIREEAYITMLSEEHLKAQVSAIIRAILQPQGYYSSDITCQKEQKRITITVKKNQPILIQHIDFELPSSLDTPKNISELNHDFKPYIGHTFTLDHYESIKNNFAVHFYEQGYLRASISDTTAHVDTQSKKASIHLRLKPGQRYKFGRLIGKDLPYNDRLLSRFGDFRSGQAFQTIQVDELRDNLLKSGLFTKLTVKPSIDEKTRTIDVHVIGEPVKADSWSLSFGLNRRSDLNLTVKNFNNRVTPWADQLATQISISLQKTREDQIPFGFKSQYTYPGLNPLTDYAGINFNIEHMLKTANLFSNRNSLALLYHRRHHFDSIDLSLNLQNEVIFNQDNTEKSSVILYPNITTHHTRGKELSLPYDLTRIRSHFSLGTINFNENDIFAKIQLGVRGAISLGNKLTLFQDSGTEVLWNQKYQDTPTNMRIYAGGAYSVRGFGLQSLGPAKSALQFSNEVIYHINETFGAGVFLDSAWLRNINNQYQSYHAWGISGDIFLPMGILQVSIGAPISAEQKKSLIQIRLIPGLEVLET